MYSPLFSIMAWCCSRFFASSFAALSKKKHPKSVRGQAQKSFYVRGGADGSLFIVQAEDAASVVMSDKASRKHDYFPGISRVGGDKSICMPYGRGVANRGVQSETAVLTSTNEQKINGQL